MLPSIAISNGLPSTLANSRACRKVPLGIRSNKLTKVSSIGTDVLKALVYNGVEILRRVLIADLMSGVMPCKAVVLAASCSASHIAC
jgi:hypothetical protein